MSQILQKISSVTAILHKTKTCYKHMLRIPSNSDASEKLHKMRAQDKAFNEVFTSEHQILNQIIAETTKHVLPVVREHLLLCEEREIRPVLDYCLDAKESCDRALLLRLGHEAFGGNWRDIIHALAAAELMDFSVIAIDDIFDESPRRMSKKTHHSMYGFKKTIASSAILKSIGSLALSKCIAGLNLNDAYTRLAFEMYEKDHLGIYIGQFMDIAYEDLGIGDVPLTRFMEMIRYTTGVQIGSMTGLGALLAKATVEDVEMMREFGTIVGTIFQMRDDFVDYVSDESLTGKTAFLDWKQQKKRFPILLAINSLPKDDVQRLLSLFDSSSLSNEESDFVVRCLLSDSVIKLARLEIGQLKQRACQYLYSLKPSPAKSFLNQVLEIGSQI